MNNHPYLEKISGIVRRWNAETYNRRRLNGANASNLVISLSIRAQAVVVSSSQQSLMLTAHRKLEPGLLMSP